MPVHNVDWKVLPANRTCRGIAAVQTHIDMGLHRFAGHLHSAHGTSSRRLVVFHGADGEGERERESESVGREDVDRNIMFQRKAMLTRNAKGEVSQADASSLETPPPLVLLRLVDICPLLVGASLRDVNEWISDSRSRHGRCC